jgi:hypothetical protein
MMGTQDMTVLALSLEHQELELCPLGNSHVALKVKQWLFLPPIRFIAVEKWLSAES